MSEERKCFTFGELIDAGVLEIGDGYRAKLDELGGSGPLFLRAGQLTPNGFVWVGAERFHEHMATSLSRKFGRPGDVVITTKGNSIGRVGFVPESAPLFVYSPHLSYWRSLDHRKLVPGYLRYWSKSAEFAAQLQAMAHGTDMAPYLSLADQRRLVISLPSYRYQKAIADVLGALDDKIALNDRIIRTCDALCGAFFQRMLGSSDIRYVKIEEIADINRESVKPNRGGHLRYLDISSVSLGSINWPERMSWEYAPSRARRKASQWDTLWSTVRPGRRSYALILENDPELVVSTGICVITPRAVGPASLYEMVRRDEVVEYLESMSEGSAYPAVRPERIAQAVVPLPQSSELQKFEGHAMKLRCRIRGAEAETRNLAGIRDALLPKLISGEIRIRDAERVAEEVA